MKTIFEKIQELTKGQKKNLCVQCYHRFFDESNDDMNILPYVEYMDANEESYLFKMLTYEGQSLKWFDAMQKGVKSYVLSGYVYKPIISFMLKETCKAYADYKDFVELPDEEVQHLTDKSVEYIQEIVDEEFNACVARTFSL